MAHAISWFDIPVLDMDRACKFYGEIFGYEFEPFEMMGTMMAMFPTAQDGSEVGGSLTLGEDYIPSTNGSIVYLNCGEDVNPVLSKVENAGGQVLLQKIQIGEHGFMGLILDTEGNKVGLYSIG